MKMKTLRPLRVSIVRPSPWWVPPPWRWYVAYVGPGEAQQTAVVIPLRRGSFEIDVSLLEELAWT